MDKKTVKAALGKRRLQSQHSVSHDSDGNAPVHTDLGSDGGQPTQSSGGAMVSISVQPLSVDQDSNEQAAGAAKLANTPYSAVKQPSMDKSGPWNQGQQPADETPNGMHQVVNGESGDKLRATPSDQQGPNRALMSKILNEQGISPMRKAMAKSKNKPDDKGSEGND